MIKENTYFDGGVKSLGFTQADGDSSVGVMAVGSYTFGTAAPEKMSVVKGALTIKRSTDADWVTFNAGESFDVEGDSSFDVKVETSTAYLCEYL
ncbi:pyrimidine/purine nucleoside phosphorylase [Vibrio methylphosphonaticus]|uniref:pyrimidine/purine nucleoside phosphorylase n=1 Tax=Vibrio methylphosphonaticus TaxID=2946866 RepID=UPI00202A420B|nr:pyrimidine/purine nucleoside phosphorylase [Vibrio methylphosphonaticus]MCL9773891.1 pyrimidine/purine nucleoside phosphorylase [Vibrio methylphosphonaticus]